VSETLDTCAAVPDVNAVVPVPVINSPTEPALALSAIVVPAMPAVVAGMISPVALTVVAATLPPDKLVAVVAVVADPAVVAVVADPAVVAVVAVAALPPMLKLATGVVDDITNGAVPVVTVEVIWLGVVKPVAVISAASVALPFITNRIIFAVVVPSTKSPLVAVR